LPQSLETIDPHERATAARLKAKIFSGDGTIAA
jgi:hypothetical protein